MFYKIIFAILLWQLTIYSQPKQEVRAVWVTTVFNLDWPTTSGQTAQKNEMISLLDLLKAANFNTIMLQVRGRGDLLYPSSIEPWAKALTGVLGSNPGWDPLQFTISEARKRGIEVHAWWNVYKVYGTGTPPSTSPLHVVLSQPGLCKLYDNEWWLDPGLPSTKTYLLNLAMEMVRKYDLDAIHFDFIRYPNPDFDDAATYATYGQGVQLADWRRNNITQFVSAIYDSIKAVKPRMKVGSAPIGIYKDLSACNSGWDSYTNTFQDSRRWLLLNKHDYHSPQIYWDINTCPRFDTLAMDWINNSNGKHIYPGIAAYRMTAGDGDWPASEILAQIDSSRKFGGKGQTFFRTVSFKNNQKSIYSLVKQGQYLYPANIPPMSWKDNIKPNAPNNLTITTSDSLTYTFKWNKPLPASDGDTAFYYNLYMDDQSPVDISDIKNVIKFRLVSDTVTSITFSSIPTTTRYFVITAYDRGYNESLVSNETAIIVTSIEQDGNAINGFNLEQNYPNPFNPTTKISWQAPISSWQTLKVYDVLGNEVATLVDEFKPAGNYEVEFNPVTSIKNPASGVYFYQLKSGEFLETKKMILLR
jgi:uncharacterized lipoprotein YddW (UPF0748 family)